MITISLDGVPGVLALLKAYPRAAGRSAEIALDRTAAEIRNAVKQAMPQVFDRPTRYTMNSLKVTPTKNHNMQASVWFKEPERMSQHYLVPQVKGLNHTRKLKGFEWALGGMPYVPGKHVDLDQHGNISAGKIRQILSVLGRAEHVAGYAANMTARSKGRSRKPRDYVWLSRGRGKLPAGIYERTSVGTGHLLSKGERRAEGKAGRGHAVFETGKGGYVRARGLRAVLVAGRKGKPVKPRLPFYELGRKVFDARFAKWFYTDLARRVSRVKR